MLLRCPRGLLPIALWCLPCLARFMLHVSTHEATESSLFSVDGTRRRLTQRAARSNAAGLESSGVRLHRLHDRLTLLESGVAGARSLGFALKRSMRVSAACAYVRGMVRGAAERIALQRSFTGEK